MDQRETPYHGTGSKEEAHGEYPFHDKVILQSTNPSSKLPNERVGWQVVDWVDADA